MAKPISSASPAGHSAASHQRCWLCLNVNQPTAAQMRNATTAQKTLYSSTDVQTGCFDSPHGETTSAATMPITPNARLIPPLMRNALAPFSAARQA